MPDFSPCPVPETCGLPLSICYIKVDKVNSGITAGNISAKQYWNHALEAWENPPRIDSKHLRTFQRLEADQSNAEFKLQLAYLAVNPMRSNNTLAVVFTTNSDGRANEILYAYTRNHGRVLAGIDF